MEVCYHVPACNSICFYAYTGRKPRVCVVFRPLGLLFDVFHPPPDGVFYPAFKSVS